MLSFSSSSRSSQRAWFGAGQLEAHSRIVSSIPKRGSPPGPRAWRTRLLSTSDARPSRGSPIGRPVAGQTASAASSVQPPAKTPGGGRAPAPPARAGRSSRRSRRAASAGAAGRSRAPPVSRARRRLQAASEHRRGEKELALPGRGQLDRQRQPVQPAADLGHRRRVLVGRARSRVDRLRPLDEERAPRRPPSATVGVRREAGASERRHRELVLAAQGAAARLVTSTVSRGRPPAGRRPAAAGEQTCSKLSSTSSMRRSRSGAGDACSGRPPASSDAERLGDGRGDQARVGDRREVDEEARRQARRRSAATCSASRVLPVPPRPAIPTRRTSGRAASSRAPPAPSRGRSAAWEAWAGSMRLRGPVWRPSPARRRDRHRGGRPEEARAASISSRQVPKRASSSLASACANTASRAAGSPGRVSLATGGGSCRCACMTATSDSRANGCARSSTRRADSRTRRRPPAEPTDSPRICSGAA